MLSLGLRFPELLIWFPLLSGVICFMIRDEKISKGWALLSSLITLGISVMSLIFSKNGELNGYTYGYQWLTSLGSSFTVAIDGVGRILTFLTAIAFPIIFAATYKNSYKNAGSYYGLMLLTQCGLMGVFLSMDALLFYFFWELALIPAYFLCSRWGGERRIQATFKFFIYTFTGSLLMLIGIISVYLQTPGTAAGAEHSFSINAFYSVAQNMSGSQQNWLFWLFFVAFAIKMPIFPFHTWQPDTYEQAPTSTTMVLSGIMVKMGLFAVIRWLLPVFPAAAISNANIVITLSVIGMIYASLLAIKQDDLKRFIAYSSIAHIGLMCAALFSRNAIGMQGVMIQMFSHGINIIGMWIVVDYIEQRTGTRKISGLGGIAHKAPGLTILLVVIALANIALPLTNAFVGEFMMFSGLFNYNIWFTVIAGLSIILAAVYTLNMIQRVFYGENKSSVSIVDISIKQKIVLGALVVMIFFAGVYPKPFFYFAGDTVKNILTRVK
jgi:NADH-quinone oxidoreductase subunit M